MESSNNFSEVMEAMFRGMDGYVSAKTVVGDPVTVNDTIIIPLVDVSFGVGAGAGLNGEKKSNTGGGGLGAKVSPSAILVIHDGQTRLVNVKNQDAVTKVLDMVPTVMDRIMPGKKDPEVEAAVEEMKKSE